MIAASVYMANFAAFLDDWRSDFPPRLDEAPDALETQREAGEGDTMELVSDQYRNEVYRVNLDCGCEFRYEPDAPSPFDLQKFAACEDDSAAHLMDGRVRAKEARIAS